MASGPTIDTQAATRNDHGKGRRIRLSALRGIFAGESEGGSLVEFAVVLPLMLTLMTGMFSFGIALNHYTMLTDASSIAARTLSVARGQTSPALAATDPCKYAVQIADSSAALLNTSQLTFTINWTTLNSSGTPVTTPYTNSCPGLSLNAGDTVQIQATYNTTLLVYGWRSVTLPLTARNAELVQ